MAFAISVLLTVVQLILWVPECSAQSQSEPVVKVNNTVLSQNDLDRVLDEMLPAMTFHSGITPEKREKYHDEAMQSLINSELFYQEAMKLNLDVGKEVKETRESAITNLGGKNQFRKELKRAGLSDKEYIAIIRKKILVKKFLGIEIDEKARVSDEEARDYFENNKEGFQRPEAWRLRHILFSVAPSASTEEWEAKRVRAEEALRKIKGGEDMAAVAWDYSDDPYRVKGGDLGIVHSGRLVATLESVVRKLEVGQVSNVVQTIYGYHIVRVEEKIQPQQLKYEEVEERIKKNLVSQKRDELEKNLIERLRAEARIEVY